MNSRRETLAMLNSSTGSSDPHESGRRDTLDMLGSDSSSSDSDFMEETNIDVTTYYNNTIL